MRTSLISCQTTLARTLSIAAVVLLALYPCISEAQVRFACPPLCPDVSVLTHHNDNARTGAQLNEMRLNPQSIMATIRANGRLLESSSGAIIQGVVTAQPLYVQGVPFPNGLIDVVYVVDSTNTVFAFSPFEDSNHQLTTMVVKPRSLEPANAIDHSTVDPVGILSTPVIDKARNLMYVVARAADPASGKGNAKFILHVLELTALTDKFPTTTITAIVQVPGGTATFVPTVERQRTALLLNQVGGRSYLSFGFGSMPGALGEGHGDGVHWQHGWAFTYDVTYDVLNRPVLANAYLSTRDPDPANPGGIWQGGAGFAANQSGDVFFATGNADYDADHDGDSIVRLTANGTKIWNVPDPNQHHLNDVDHDLGGGGPIVLPHNSGASRAFVIGKDGSADLVRVYDDNPTIIQPFQAVPNPNDMDYIFFGNPVYWNGHVYYMGSGDYLYSLPWDPAQGIFTSTTPTRISQNRDPDPPDNCGHRGVSLSANGTSGAILWLTRKGGSGCPGALDAYDPTTPDSPPIFHWSASPGDQLSDFPVATVAGGRVFLITVSNGGYGPGSTLHEFTTVPTYCRFCTLP